MKVAANVVAMMAWACFLAVVVMPLVRGELPPMGLWLGVILLSFLTGLVVPSYLLNLEARLANNGRVGTASKPAGKRDA